MPKLSEGQYAIGGLTIFAVWVFVVLPFLYQTPIDHSELWSAKLTDWLPAVFTLALAIFTQRLYQATVGMWDATKELRNFAEEQSRDMKASIAATHQTAEAAKSSAETAERSFTLLERPYVIPDNVGHLESTIRVGNRTDSTSFRIGNYGKVPAIVHRVGARFAIIELPVTHKKLKAPNFGPGQERVEAWMPHVVLAQGATYELPTFYVPHGMRNVEIEFSGRCARPKIVGQHEFLLGITVEYEDAASGVMRVGFTPWKYGLEGFTRYGGKQYNYEQSSG
jgi:hypothetical protein